MDLLALVGVGPNPGVGGGGGYCLFRSLLQAGEAAQSLQDLAHGVIGFEAGSGDLGFRGGLCAALNGGWEDESQLQDQFLTRKGFAFNADKPGMMEQQADLFKAALKKDPQLKKTKLSWMSRVLLRSFCRRSRTANLLKPKRRLIWITIMTESVSWTITFLHGGSTDSILP